MQVATVAAGRVGLSTALSFAHIGHEATCADDRTEAKLLDARNALERSSVEAA